MTLPAAVVSAFQAHARAEYPRECCGLVAGGEYLPQANVADDPTKDFIIAAEAYLRHAGRIEAVLHSHPIEPGERACPSAADMRGQLSTAAPWGLVGVTAETVTDVILWGDQLPIRDLVGRPFVHGVWDCFSLVRDYYRLEGRGTLPEYPRDDEWWTRGENLYAEGLASAPGVRAVERTELRPGDAVLMRIRSKVVNHAGIYLGDGVVLHHLHGRLSAREEVSPFARFIAGFARYEP